MLAFLLALVAFLTLLGVVLPLLRPAGPAAKSDTGDARFDRAVYRDQLAELDRDLARGTLSDAEAASARVEIQRRLLATDARAERGGNLAASPVMAVVVGFAIACGSVALYLNMGAPQVPDMPFAARQSDAQPNPTASGQAAAGGDVAAIAARIDERLRADPSNPDLWLLRARSAATLRDWPMAGEAYRRALALGATDPDTQASYGEILVVLADGVVTPEALAVFEAALRDDPRHTMSRYYLALAAGQAGEAAKAIALFQAVLADLPDNAPPRAEVVRRMNDVAQAAGIAKPVPAKPTAPGPTAPGPDADTVAAAANMPPAERNAMIEGMVARLADRLRAEPNDLDGWLRLGRARAVLGQREPAADAFERAASLRPTDMRIKMQLVDALLAGLPPSDPFPDHAVAVLKEVEQLAPDEPAALWYLGILAARERQPDKARAYWTRLLPALSPDSEEGRLVRSAIDALRGR